MKPRNTLMQRIAALALAGMAVTYYKKRKPDEKRERTPHPFPFVFTTKTRN